MRLKSNHRGRTYRWGLVLVGLVLVGLVPVLGAADASGQQWSWPEKPENAQVLPETITSRQLQGVMIGFVRALGVRCSHCHVGEEGQPLSQYDFASDDRPAKDKARVMMRMVRAINDDHLPELGVAQGERTAVTCVTCHRGASKPRMLDDVLREKLEAEGTEAMVAEYRVLREQYHGGFTYDFNENVLNRLGYELLRGGRVEAAIALFRVNTEFFPASGNAYDSLAEGYMTAGDTTRAIVFYQKSLEADPDNRNAAQKLQELSGR